MDKGKQVKETPWLNNGKECNAKFIHWVLKVAAWYKKERMASEWLHHYMQTIKMQVEHKGPISIDFRSEKQLIPVIFSHGYTATRLFYTVVGREMASHGYIVFLIDHHDGSCPYTKKITDEVTFDFNSHITDQVGLAKMNQTRVDEVRDLITAIG